MRKRIRFQFEGNTYVVDVEREGNTLTLEREGEVYKVMLLPEEKPQSLAERVAAGQPALTAAPAQTQTQAVPAASVPAAGEVEAAGETAAPTGTGESIVAPITGVVKEIKSNSGMRVEKGQVVMVMEAMKMDIDVYAPISGVINEVFVHQGDSVRANQLLLTVA
ncbi:MAG: hypothetical protein J7K04_10735 [Spirochaetales bacterium]|nr:hypothetical protein [Spirochaetales bacterium]